MASEPTKSAARDLALVAWTSVALGTAGTLICGFSIVEMVSTEPGAAVPPLGRVAILSAQCVLFAIAGIGGLVSMSGTLVSSRFRSGMIAVLVAWGVLLLIAGSRVVYLWAFEPTDFRQLAGVAAFSGLVCSAVGASFAVAGALVWRRYLDGRR